MYEEIHENAPTVKSRSMWIRVESINKCKNVVVPVKKHEWFFSQNQKYGISQFEQLWYNEQPTPETVRSLGETVNFTVRSLEAIILNSTNKFWKKHNSPHNAEQCKKCIPNIQR